MTQLKDKIQNAMDESRMLILGAEILVGFEFTAVFQERFRELSPRSQELDVFALTLMLFTLALLIAPAAFHQLAERGEDSVRLHGFATHVMEVALLPFALGLGANVYIPAEETNGPITGLAFGLTATLAALFLWYGPILLRRRSRSSKLTDDASRQGKGNGAACTPNHDKIRQVLTEARVIIPGNQALLGFQFAVILQRGFSELSPWLKWLHLSSLSLITLSTILLLTPAAYHRIVENGEETTGFYRVAHVLVLSALPPLAIGVCGDFFIIVFKITGKMALSLTGCLIMLAIFVALWFGYTLYRRHRQARLAGAVEAE
jgi:hypothetical protein